MLTRRTILTAVTFALIPLGGAVAPPDVADNVAPSTMHVFLIDGETLAWSPPALSPADLADVRYHIFGYDADGNRTLLSIEEGTTFMTGVPDDYVSYVVTVVQGGTFRESSGPCYVIYLSRIPPTVARNCAPPVSKLPDKPVTILLP